MQLYILRGYCIIRGCYNAFQAVHVLKFSFGNINKCRKHNFCTYFSWEKTKFIGITFSFHLIIADSACYIRNNHTTMRPFIRYSIYREIWLRWFSWDFNFTWKSCKNHAKFRQNVTHGSFMQTCLHDICLRIFIIIMSLIFCMMFMQLGTCVKFICN